MTNKETYLPRAIREGHAKFVSEGKQRKIVYLAINHSERYSDPEEKVRAEFWAELIYRYQYDPQRIGIEITVPDRTPHDRADIVIFHDDERKRPYAVIECKKDGISDSEFEQAVEQAWGNASWAKLRASYVGVVAGSTRRFFDCSNKWGALEREKNIVADLPIRYGKPMEFKYYKGGVTPDGKKALDIQPVSREELISAIQKSHQTLWGGGRMSPPAAFGELSKVLFVKIADEKKPRKKGEPYAFQIKTNESSRQLASRIRALYAKEQTKDPDVFTDTIKIDDATLRTLVSHLESININETDLDTKGIAFEQFMDGFFKGGFGQYFTPRPIIQFAVEMMQPTHEDIVLDPACGSGGFLLYAMDAVRAEADEYYPDDPAKNYRHWHDFAQNNLFGIEINEEIARVAKMNMIVHDDGHSNVIGADALDRIERLYEINRGFVRDRFTLVLTNPPFGAEVKKSERHYLGDYDLGTKKVKKEKVTIRPKQKTEILFLERIWHFLKPGEGRAAVVVPDGILTNSSLQYVRDWLLEHFQLLAVVSLPQTAFSHYGAGVKSSIIFLRKRAEDETPDDDEAIFMAVPELIGYDATGRETENQLPEIVEKYREFLKEPDPFFA